MGGERIGKEERGIEKRWRIEERKGVGWVERKRSVEGRRKEKRKKERNEKEVRL